MIIRELSIKRHRARGERQSKDDVLAKFSKLLEQHPPTKDDAPESQPACPVCADRGWVSEYVDDYNMRAIPCPANCETTLTIQRKRNQSKMQAVIERKAPPLNIALRDYMPRSREQERAYSAALHFTTDEIGFAVDGLFKQSMVLTGQVGSGKTYLASAIHNELDMRGHEVWYMKFGEMIRRVNDCFDSSISVTPLQVIQALQYVDVLILDDVGRDNVSDATRDLFFDIIDARYDLNLPTVITTNLNQEQMKSMFGARLDGRLRHIAHWVRLDGNLRDQTGVL